MKPRTTPASSRTPRSTRQDGALVTPASSFYLIDTALVSPDRREQLEALGKGLNDPIELSYKDLLGMSTREASAARSVPNVVGGGLVSNSRWTGVLLSDVLAEPG